MKNILGYDCCAIYWPFGAIHKLDPCYSFGYRSINHRQAHSKSNEETWLRSSYEHSPLINI